MTNVTQPQRDRGYIPLADHGLIGNLRTAALISTDGSDYLPRQPSSAKARPLLAWLIRRVEVIRGSMPLRVECAPAFNYARSPHTTDIMLDTSVALSLPPVPREAHNKALFSSPEANLTLDLRYIAESTLDNVPEPEVQLNLLYLSDKGHKGPGVWSHLELKEGQAVTFVLRTPPDVQLPREAHPTHETAEEMGIPYEKLIAGASTLRPPGDPILTKTLLRDLLDQTNSYWNAWIGRSTYTGSWKEAVNRSALALKLLIYEPTGAVVASPTFSLPEYIGGTRNWDYRASWIRDSSFTLYALIRLGFTHEANAYMEFIFERVRARDPDGSLKIMYTIHGEKEFPEEELTHLDGHKGSKPVRIGNGAIDHVQLDIYGELMDCIYLSQKYGRPLGYDTWVAIRDIRDRARARSGLVRLYFMNTVSSASRMLIRHILPPLLTGRSGQRLGHGREVRNRHRHFTYSKVMMWVAIDRGIRLAEKRSLPCPRRNEWYAARDALYEEIMQKAWNPDKRFFAQSYEDLEILDSALLIMPLVFFSTPADPRFLSTLKQILLSPERGGLTSNGLVYRYDVSKTDDGVGGEEGTFCLCTLWCIEALARAGEYDKAMLNKAVAMFEDFLQYTNHLGLCTEEISDAGEALGNAVQGFTHVTLISAAYNLSRMRAKVTRPY
ncbi:hypothetical protein ONZ51_g1206 [Trametes cubensis]|uniref:GH15-like domain-containing protein n=1 Tax=Trametes cubensis TaxID=1111947 RepID=A0AAD7U2L7_9APHY|nr:hypothetical protein ONZ51_g1206 [Trametes cubensis]